MSMGCAAASADVVKEDAIKKFCPKEFKAFQDVIDNTSCTMEDVARAGQFDSIESDCTKEIADAYGNLCEAFEKKTGLKLFINYHDSDNEGDRYDDVSGLFWSVENMYQLSPAGKKMKKYVEHKTFVQFG